MKLDANSTVADYYRMVLAENYDRVFAAAWLRDTRRVRDMFASNFAALAPKFKTNKPDNPLSYDLLEHMRQAAVLTRKQLTQRMLDAKGLSSSEVFGGVGL